MPPFQAVGWLNSPPLTPEGLRGRVVLVDFWEYTCVNCLRTLPFVKAWHARYAPAGLVVVGIHAPEFAFGRNEPNVARGVREFDLRYPIALDSDYATWNAYHQRAWPAKYLFDAGGKLRGVWLGEGHYGEIETLVRQLLAEARPRAALPAPTEETARWDEDFSARAGVTPETYLGTVRRKRGTFRTEGDWLDHPESIEHRGTGVGRLILDFVAGEVNLVMTPGPSGKAVVRVLLDGVPVPAGSRGADVGPDGVARFDRSGMIRLVAGAKKERHRLVLETRDPGLRTFAFTFGP
jgi:thiol-disulfide isomerase/thioredoxin